MSILDSNDLSDIFKSRQIDIIPADIYYSGIDIFLAEKEEGDLE